MAVTVVSPFIGAPRADRHSGYPWRLGAIAQLGERLDRTQEVAGSSPASSTLEPAGNGGFSFSDVERGRRIGKWFGKFTPTRAYVVHRAA